MKQETILVVDDEAKIAEVIGSYLEKANYKVIYAQSGYDALKMFEMHSPSLVILDLMLPDLSGEEVCRAIRRRSRAPVIMLTAKAAEEEIIGGLNIGADDYVTKPFSNRQLLARVEAVLRRTSSEAVPIAKTMSFNNGELTIDSAKREVKLKGETVSLTRNEYNLLLTLVKYPAKVFTREELIAFAFNEDFKGYDRVIDTHMKNIRQKIEKDTKAPRYILTVHGVGYRFGGETCEA